MRSGRESVKVSDQVDGCHVVSIDVSLLIRNRAMSISYP